MFTGGFEKMSRSEAKSFAENQGAKISSNISKKTDILIVGNSKPTKRKVEESKFSWFSLIILSSLINFYFLVMIVGSYSILRLANFNLTKGEACIVVDASAE